MLEVGRIKTKDPAMTKSWNRAHFGAWCVISAPLILGLDVSQPALVTPVVDIITNAEAVSINQQWSGHPGGLVWSGQGGLLGYPAARKYAYIRILAVHSLSNLCCSSLSESGATPPTLRSSKRDGR